MLRVSTLLVALSVLPATAHAQSCTITKQVYDSIRTQSTEIQVAAVVGCAGKVIFEGAGVMTGKPARTITYPGTKPGSSARFNFEGDRLMVKASNGGLE